MNWNDLTMAQKNELMQTYIRNGVTSLEDMRGHFNSFGDGGPKKTYKQWSNEMHVKYPWLELDSNKAGYDYERYFNENYNDAIARLNESEARHFTDRYKLPNHPTFSNESIYSQGPRYGGEWTDDDRFIPSIINQQQHSNVYDQDRAYTEKEIYDRLHRFDEGGPAGAVKKAMYDRMPIAGTFVLPEVDITPEQERPNWFARQSMNAAMAENAPYMQAVGWQQDRNGNYHQDPTTPGADELRKALFEVGVNGAMDIFGGPIIEKALQGAGKAYKIAKTAKTDKIVKTAKENNKILEAVEDQLANMKHLSGKTKDELREMAKRLVKSDYENQIFDESNPLFSNKLVKGTDYTEIPIRQKTKDTFTREVFPRMFSDPDRADIFNTLYSSDVSKKAAMQDAIDDTFKQRQYLVNSDVFDMIDDEAAGLHYPDRGVLFKNKGNADDVLNYAEGHELRHELQDVLPRTSSEQKILENAYSDVPNPYNYKYDMSDEWETMNYDARQAIFGKYNASVELQNKILDEITNNEGLVKVLKTADGYWSDYIDALTKAGVDLNTKIPAWKEAMKKIGAVVPLGTGIGVAAKNNGHRLGGYLFKNGRLLI